MSFAIPFTAFFNPLEELRLEAHEIAERVSTGIPGATIDWERGAAWHERRLDELEAMGLPPSLLGREESRGCHFYLSITLEDNSTLSGIGRPLARDLGDTMELDLEPYSTKQLIAGAKSFAEAVGLCYWLKHEDSQDNSRLELSTANVACTDPSEIARDNFLHPNPLEPEQDLLRLTPLADWRISLTNAIVERTRRSDYEPSSYFLQYSNAETYATAVVEELEEIATPKRGWNMDMPNWKLQNGMLLDQGVWTTAIMMNGTPKGLFK